MLMEVENKFVNEVECDFQSFFISFDGIFLEIRRASDDSLSRFSEQRTIIT